MNYLSLGITIGMFGVVSCAGFATATVCPKVTTMENFNATRVSRFLELRP